MRQTHEEKEKLITVAEAAEIIDLQQPSIRAAIKCKRIPVTRMHGRVFIKMKDLENYKKKKYDRFYSLDDKGHRIYDRKSGIYSPRMISKIFNIPVHHIYHAIYTDKIKYEKYRSSYIIKNEDVLDYLALEIPIRKYTPHRKRKIRKES